VYGVNVIDHLVKALMHSLMKKLQFTFTNRIAISSTSVKNQKAHLIFMLYALHHCKSTGTKNILSILMKSRPLFAWKQKVSVKYGVCFISFVVSVFFNFTTVVSHLNLILFKPLPPNIKTKKFEIFDFKRRLQELFFE
jgi:hypothetical protein